VSDEDISRVKVKFVIEALGEAEGELVRFLAPRTVDTIVRKLPVEGVRKNDNLKIGESLLI